MKRLAIITTHPIQYNAPWFKFLADRGIVTIKVFYTWGEKVLQSKYDPGFGKNIEWDIPLLNGYEYHFVQNIAKEPGSHHFKGIDNPTLINDIELWNPDAVLVFGWSFKSHLKILRHFKGKKVVLFRGDSTLLDELEGISVKKIFRRIFLKWIYSHVDIALYVGTANKSYYLKHGLNNQRLFFAPHAIDNARFKKQIITDERKKMQIPDEAVVFLFTGKMELKKNPFLLLNAFIELNKKNVHLLMVGSGELEEQLKRKSFQQTEELYKRIHFLPFQNQSQMPSIYRTGDVLVLPSQGPGETWGLSVNEAMACGKTVLVSDKCGCAADLVKDGLNGFIFKSNDIVDLLDKMNILLSGRKKLTGMGKQSLKMIDSWRYEKICDTVEQIIAR